ncbi:MAG TPA: glycoside hydrolase family 9 protein, partial [Conexibacter sp.]|nr:glycoside hydrolase family 9 protein [Conexibacter sp.]
MAWRVWTGALAAALSALLLAAASGGRAAAAAPVHAYVRVDQVGFATGAPARALLLASGPLPGARFAVVAADGSVVRGGASGPPLGRWSARFPVVLPLALGALPGPAADRVVVTRGGATVAVSPPFRVDAPAALFRPLAGNAIAFLRAQRDGANVDPALLGRRPAHLLDAHATLFRTPAYRGHVLAGALRPAGGTIDASGGWSDAGDYLKFFETASFTDVLLLAALRDHPHAFPDLPAARAEARAGIDWLLRMWDPARGRLAYQVGIGDGNARLLGAHDMPWHLPQVDDGLRARPGRGAWYVAHRPAFVTGGGRGGTVSPNLAGRGAAAFALCDQVFRAGDRALARRCLSAARSLFAHARTSHVGRLVTAAPYDYYPEREWRDDMELGAVEIARALAAGAGGRYTPAAARYRRVAAHWADAYMNSPLAGTDTFNLFDVGALAHAELVWTIDRWDDADLGVGRAELVADLRDQLALWERVGRRDPFGLGDDYTDGDVTQHALGLAWEARAYDAMARTTRFASFARHQLDVALGANAWGSSFVVGAGTTFPRCLHHQVANLSGSLDGTGTLLL